MGADAIFACLGPALEIFSRYTRVEKANGETVSLKEYLEQVWAAVAKEALARIFAGADATGFEADARLTATWLWTLSTAAANGNGTSAVETLAVACSHMANTVMLAVYRRCKWPKRILLQCQLTLSLHSAATSNKLLAVRQLS